jgi:hypothetical protein
VPDIDLIPKDGAAKKKMSLGYRFQQEKGGRRAVGLDLYLEPQRRKGRKGRSFFAESGACYSKLKIVFNSSLRFNKTTMPCAQSIHPNHPLLKELAQQLLCL